MTGFVVVGTDTDAGKTTFSAQWMAAFARQFAYWKPVETGESDSETIRRLVPTAQIVSPHARFREPVAPVLAAAREGRAMTSVAEVLAALPDSSMPLLVETFGSPLSPFTHEMLQAEFIAALGLPLILVTPSTIGAIGRVLQTVAGLNDFGLNLAAVVMVGEADAFAASQIERHTQTPVLSVHAVETWTPEGVRTAAEGNREPFVRLLHLIETPATDAVAELIRRDRETVWHPYTPLVSPDDPLPVVAADAEFLTLANGRRIIDGISSWWTILHAHRHPPLVAALREASRTLDHSLFAGATHPPGVELAERMLATAPWNGGRVFFSDNGSTAVEIALKMAYQAWCHRDEPRRQLFIGFENSYHGDTFGAMAASRDPLFFGRFEPLLFQTVKVPVSAECLDDALKSHRGEVAGVILEPLVQGAGGIQMHPPSVLRDIFTVTREHGVFFIADEVMTGCGRTGSLWAFEQAGIAPDLICSAKTLAGGLLPLAATLASPEVVAAFDTPDRARTFFHGHSFAGHALACAVAVVNWNELRGGRWHADAQRIEGVWRERLEPLRERPRVRDVRIRGTIAAIECESPGGYLAEVSPLFRRICLDHDVLLRPLGNVLYAMPPLLTRTNSLHRIADAMAACIHALGAGGTS